MPPWFSASCWHTGSGPSDPGLILADTLPISVISSIYQMLRLGLGETKEGAQEQVTRKRSHHLFLPHAAMAQHLSYLWTFAKNTEDNPLIPYILSE